MTDPQTPETGTGGQAARGIQMFDFGDAEPVLDRRELATYFDAAFNGRYYEPPISFCGLARALKANPHHESAVGLKIQMLASLYRPTPLLSRSDMQRVVQDYVIFGNAWLEQINNMLGAPLRLRPTLARWTRVRPDGRALMLIDDVEHDFPGPVLQIAQPDPSQEIYGRPSYEACIQSALLNESATLFRRKYYLNGSHAGFILYLTDPAQNQDDIDALRAAMKAAKGPGNFRNLFLYSPNGKADGLKLIPVAEVAAKDEFLHMKTVTRDDVLAAHRVPPQLLGIVPAVSGGFGDVEKAMGAFYRLELRPIATLIAAAINDWLGTEEVVFDEFCPPTAGP